MSNHDAIQSAYDTYLDENAKFEDKGVNKNKNKEKNRRARPEFSNISRLALHGSP